ncbi:MAG: T9SS type A sorting domain-containing protein [bacterium]
MYKLLLILAILTLQLINVNFAHSQDSRGRDFVVTFLPNYHQTGWETYDYLGLYITGPEGTSGIIEFKDIARQQFNINFVIPASGVYYYQVYWKDFELQGFLQNGLDNPIKQNNQIAPQSFRITSNLDVSVYALNKAMKSSDATIVFPVNVLGKEYILASYNSDEPNNPDSAGVNQNAFTPSEFAVVATENNTTVDFELTADAFSHGTLPFSRTLNAGDVFLVQTKYNDTGVYGDLTGSYVKADKPIAVFGGHQRALIPKKYVETLNSRDQIYEQMIPIEALGRTYIITPFADMIGFHGNGYNIYRIIAAFDSTAIYVNGSLKGIYNKGKFFEGKLDKAYVVTASKGVLAAQYMQSTGLVYSTESFKGDPSMLIVPPKKQYLTEYTTYNIQAKEYNDELGTNIYKYQYVTIIAPSAYIYTIKMDENFVDPSVFTSISNTCYSYASFPVADGVHNFHCEKPFGVYIYGYGNADSYGYNGGMNFGKVVEVIPDAKGEKVICPGDSVMLSAEGCVDIYWTPKNTLDNSDIRTPIAYPKKTTWYKAYMTDSLGCTYIDSVKITVVPSPFIEAGRDTSLCLGNLTILKPSGGTDYLWDKNPTLSCTNCKNPAATPVKSTWYYVTSTDIYGCGGRDSVYISIRPAPTIDAGRDTAFCLGNSLELRPSGGSYYTWDFDKSLSCIECDNPLASPTKKTTYFVTGYNEFGCLARDSITLDIFESDLIDAGKDTAICYGTSIRLNATGAVNYTWEYNPALSCWDCANPIALTNNDEIYYVSGVDSNGCFGRDSIKVKVYPDFTLSVSNDTTICIGKKAILKAKGAYKYHWEPADKVLCDSCDITESIIDSTITFYVTAESINGCQKRDSIQVTAVNCDLGINDLVYPLDVYCYDESSPCIIKNTGELPIRLDSLVLDGRDKGNFSIIPTGQYPLLIPKGGDYKFNVEFHPDTKSIFDAFIKVHSNLTPVDTIHITAEKRIAGLKLSATMSGGSKPGDTCNVMLNISSDDWSRLHVKYLNLKLQYKYYKFFADENHFALCGDMPNNWDVSAQRGYDIANQLEIWDINLSGVDELKGNTCLTLIRPIYMLHTNVVYDIEVSGAVPAHEICTQVDGTKANINLSYCLDTIRAISIGVGQFGYEIPNQICNNVLNARAYLPFAANVEISIIDVLGKEKNIFKGRLEQGYTQLDHDISNYPAGVYFISFKSGQVVITKKIIINTN